MLIWKELGEKRAHWIIALKEYDLDIKLSKMVKGQGLCLLAAQSNVLEKEWQTVHKEEMSADVIDFITAQSFEWYDDIIFYLIHGYAPSTLDLKKCRTLRLKATPY